MRQNRHYIFDMSYLEDLEGFKVLIGIRVDVHVFKFYGVGARVLE